MMRARRNGQFAQEWRRTLPWLQHLERVSVGPWNVLIVPNTSRFFHQLDGDVEDVVRLRVTPLLGDEPVPDGRELGRQRSRRFEVLQPLFGVMVYAPRALTVLPVSGQAFHAGLVHVARKQLGALGQAGELLVVRND